MAIPFGIMVLKSVLMITSKFIQLMVVRSQDDDRVTTGGYISFTCQGRDNGGRTSTFLLTMNDDSQRFNGKVITCAIKLWQVL